MSERKLTFNRTHPLLERSLPAVRRNFPDVVLNELGSWQVEVTATVSGHTVKTWLPVMFPVAAPAYFWTPNISGYPDADDPRTPSLQIAPNGEVMRWWMYKPSEWNPNRHGLLTWLHQIASVIQCSEEAPPDVE